MELRDFFAALSERGKLFVVVIIWSTVAGLLSLLIGGWWATAGVVIPAILSILQVTKGIWTPEGGGKSKIALASLGVMFAAIVVSERWRPFVDPLIAPLYEKAPFLKDKLPYDAPSITALIFLTAAILIVNYFARDTTAMRKHPTPLEKEFPDNYKTLLNHFCSILLTDLNSIDLENNWSPEIFTPLDAEVEVKSESKRLKKLTDLLNGIRSDRQSRVFLVLGDPGSGKSVALRKLCRELLAEVQITGKVPLYVNLREWAPQERWSESNQPTVESLYTFVLNNLKNRVDVFANEFLDRYFKDMFRNGRLFIILDSFDEIPQVLDAKEHSWLIDSLSATIYRFLAGAHESRGLLASRLFRRPTEKFDARTILEIRPFTDSKIVETLKKSPYFSKSLVTQLAKAKPQLFSIARNPFVASLLASYARYHHDKLPETQSNLYSDYIASRLDACSSKIAEKGLTKTRVYAGAIEIAYAMLKTNEAELEASVSDLRTMMPQDSIEEIMEILKYGRLGRLGGRFHRKFSFIHRRFHEYFAVQKMIEQPEVIPRDAIPTDSRWRDSLVLYCEMADEEKARRIADSCWSEVREMGRDNLDLQSSQCVRSMACLRFLEEAFRVRLHCVDSFRGELAKFVIRQIEGKHSLLSVKLAVEAVGLLEQKDIDVAVVKALDLGNQWINETAFRSCCYLKSMSEELTQKLRRWIDQLGFFGYLRRAREIMFSIQLSSDAFDDLRTFCFWRAIDCCCFMLGISVFFFAWYSGSICSTDLPSTFLVASGLLLLMSTSNLNQIKNVVPDIIGQFRVSVILALGIVQINGMLRTIVWRGFWWGKPWDFADVVLDTLLSSPLVIASAILIMPWCQLYYHFLPLIGRLTVRHVFRAIVTLALFSIMAVGSYIILPLTPISKTLDVLLAIVIILSTGLSGYWGILWIVDWCSDAAWLRDLPKSPGLGRQQIYEEFYCLRTKLGRLRYVRFLQDSGSPPTGTWPGRQIPNNDNDEASTLLARLEEKWLRLDK